MLRITIPEIELYNEKTNEFTTIRPTFLTLEHSLVSISKWESKWCKPFISQEERTNEELIDYIRCMTLTQNVNPIVYRHIPMKECQKIKDYIEAPMTATTFRKDPMAGTGARAAHVVTSELLYYFMIQFGIPWECEKWHLNRLITLIHVCEEKNKPKKKMSKRDLMARNSSLNAQRRAMIGNGG